MTKPRVAMMGSHAPNKHVNLMRPKRAVHFRGMRAHRLRTRR